MWNTLGPEKASENARSENRSGRAAGQWELAVRPNKPARVILGGMHGEEGAGGRESVTGTPSIHPFSAQAYFQDRPLCSK